MNQTGVRPAHQTAANMTERYGAEASVHATYNLMNYDRGTHGYMYWLSVLDMIRAHTRNTTKGDETSQNI